MKRRAHLLIYCFILSLSLHAQEYIRGNFPGHARQPVSLLVYNGFQRQQVAETIVDSLGNFHFSYPANYYGVAFLQFNKAEGIELMLTSNRGFKVSGTTVLEIDSLSCENSEINQTLYTYYKQQISREKALMGWKFLAKVYRDDTYLKRTNQLEGITKEIYSLDKESTDFIQGLPESSNLRWYLPLVRFVRDMPVSVQREPERIPKHIDFFRHIDFSDERFYNSGLLPVLMENYYFMLENMGQPLDSAYKEMNKSTDYLLECLETKRPEWLQETSLFLFNLFERRSLFPAAEHLSLAMLSQNSCVLENGIKNRFEGYKSMKKGMKAPDIDFSSTIISQMANSDVKRTDLLKGYTSLLDIDAKYKLVFFGSSGCPECKRQVPRLREMYSEMKKMNMEVIYVSLDTTNADFEQVAEDCQWVSYCDYQGWNSQPVINYHVFATPTMFLLNTDLQILYKIVSPEHLEAVMKVLRE